MRSRPLASAAVRTILAVVFGFMSLFHGTVMAFAGANLAASVDASAQHVLQHANHANHQHNGHAQDVPEGKADAAVSCYGVGCFLALNSFAVAPPCAGVKLMATLSPAVDRMMVPTILDPAVPPPRIQI